MNKVAPWGYVALAVGFGVVSAVAFCVPTEKAESFWVSYLFTLAAFALQVLFWKAAFSGKNAPARNFLGIPLAYLGTAYLVVQIAVFALFVFLPAAPLWSALLVNVLVCGVFALCLIGAHVGRGVIQQTEDDVRGRVSLMRSLEVEVESCLGQAGTPEERKALQRLAEKLRFSDPMGNDRLAELEETISQKVAALKTTGDKIPAVEDIETLLEERNRKCKAFK